MMMRSGQHNNNKRRGRNRGRHGGGGGGGGGGHNGNPANRVFDSNGPDVKLRGTAQTIAEKYMQLGRDAQSSGDGVMAESYYQHGEHYYRLWLANQPAGQPIQFSRRLNQDEEFEDDVAEGGAEAAEGEELATEAGGEEVETAEGETSADAGEGQQPRQMRQQREFRDGDSNREGGGQRRDRFRNRWQRRGERDGNRDDLQGEANGNSAEGGSTEQRMPRERFERQDRPERVERVERAERPERIERSERPEQAQDDNWEAPSFLKRPMPAARSESEQGEEQPPVRRSRGRRPQVEGNDLAPAESDGD